MSDLAAVCGCGEIVDVARPVDPWDIESSECPCGRKVSVSYNVDVSDE